MQGDAEDGKYYVICSKFNNVFSGTRILKTSQDFTKLTPSFNSPLFGHDVQ